MENRKIFSVRKNCVWKTQKDNSYADFVYGNDKSNLHTQIDWLGRTTYYVFGITYLVKRTTYNELSTSYWVKRIT
jgi:hypothetical protein